MSDAPLTYGGVPPVRTDHTTNRIRIVLRQMAGAVEQVNRDNGWYDSDRTVLEGQMLIVTEAAEAADAWRKYGFEDVLKCAIVPGEDTAEVYTGTVKAPGTVTLNHEHNAACKPEGYGSEMADILIRLLDQCSRDGVDLAGEFTRKLDYNRTRGYRHGGRAI